MKLYSAPEMQLLIDYTGMDMDEGFTDRIADPMNKALDAMEELEAGGIANPDEGRMVGHYWLRAPQMAPNAEIRGEIEDCVKDIDEFVKNVHTGEIRPSEGSYKHVLVCGIGGSSLGPEFVSKALASKEDKMDLFFLDNTDPIGMDRIYQQVEDELDQTLTVVISKSGGTVETRNAMLETQAFYKRNGVDFASHAVCISGVGSKLWKTAESEGWLRLFPMWDWVGGRTSVMSAVGLLPLGLQGIDTKALLLGAAQADQWGRSREFRNNPAAIMAACWYKCTGGKGGTADVILPYRDSLVMLPKYLQQLVMESLGKEYDLDGNRVCQGLAVMGNKGSSDQHSYVQQLVGGPDNIFVTFIQTLKDRCGENIDVDANGGGTTSGDYLNAFMLGTAKALKAHGKASMTITVPDVSAVSIGRLIALFERTVGIYAKLININAYHQPAVEAGKKAAAGLIELQHRILAVLEENKNGSAAPGPENGLTAGAIAEKLSADPDDVFRLLLHLAAADRVTMHPADDLMQSKFTIG